MSDFGNMAEEYSCNESRQRRLLVLILDDFERGTVTSSCFIKGIVHRKSDKIFPRANVELHREKATMTSSSELVTYQIISNQGGLAGKCQSFLCLFTRLKSIQYMNVFLTFREEMVVLF